MREDLLKEKHSGCLASHFGKDKTLAKLQEFYYWPHMQVDARRFVERCWICQYAKERSQNSGLYQPSPIPK